MTRFFLLKTFTLMALATPFVHLGACSINDLNKEIKSLKNKIESITSGKNDAVADLKKEIQGNRTQIELLKKEIEILKKLTEKLNQQQQIGKESKELEHILIKYGNNPDKLTPFHYAIKVGDINAVTTLLNEKCADIYSVEYMNGYETKSNKITPLVRAALWNQYEIAKLLIDLGADVNVSSVNAVMKPMPGYTALHYARIYGSEELISLLVEHGGI